MKDEHTSADSERRRRPRLGLLRFIAVFAVSALSLLLMAWILPGLSVSGWEALVLAVGVISLLNALVWPLIARYAAGLILITLGILGLVLNGLFLMLAAEIVPGFDVSTLWIAVVASLGMTAVSAILGNVLTLDDDAVWRRQVVHRMVQRVDAPEETDVPGVLFLQIDGLSEAVLRRAIGEGYAPVLADWVRSGSHRIIGWECDLSSQTGASQAGILHGDNSDMPAFRWYDKESGRVFTSNNPKDAAEIEAQRSDGQGLLSTGGVSRSNVFSGDSPDSLFTFSTVADRSRSQTKGFNFFMAHPYAISRLIVMSIADIGRELAASRRARRRDIRPRMHRGGVYPLLRAATTVMLQDLTIYTLMADIYRGVPAAYVDFVGYDEVAHHSGIAAPDALETLYRLDQQLARLRRAIDEAPRPYHVVVLSDHGQTQGSTFLQRYDMSLGDLVGSLIDRSQTVDAPNMSPEGWGNLNGVLTDTIKDQDSRLSSMLRVVVRRRTIDGNVVLGPGEEGKQPEKDPESSGPVVLASGNLGLVSFPEIPGRATFEELAAQYPGLVGGLAGHPGIGFVLVKSETLGSMVIGSAGIHYLDDGRVEGTDPLEHFGPRAIEHVRRTDSFGNTPDLLVNSFYDPETDEGAAFEELIGFHGGMGGKQTEPFVMFPRSFPAPTEPIVGAAAIHHLLSGWLAGAASKSYGAPWSIEEEPAAHVTLPHVPAAGA